MSRWWWMQLELTDSPIHKYMCQDEAKWTLNWLTWVGMCVKTKVYTPWTEWLTWSTRTCVRMKVVTSSTAVHVQMTVVALKVPLERACMSQSYPDQTHLICWPGSVKIFHQRTNGGQRLFRWVGHVVGVHCPDGLCTDITVAEHNCHKKGTSHFTP